LAAVVVGGKILLFSDLSIASFAIRSIVAGLVVLPLWFAFFRRRLTKLP